MENQLSKYSVLQEYFGYREFRGGQAEIIDALAAGRDALCIMPTGGGKSLCYQIPALLLPGVTLVISPLISLMQDQVRALTRAGIRAAYINSSLTASQYSRVLDMAADGAYKIIYVAPERLAVPEFMAVCTNLEISLIAVDEAHCVSQWGQDFRPHYLRIPDFVQALPRRPVMGAFTATATAAVREDVTRLLGLGDPLVITTGFDRPNLYFGVKETSGRQKNAELLSLLAGRGEQSGIVYCATRRAVEEVTELLCESGIPATRYHAGLSDEERRRNQEDFVYDRIPVMVATNAFGMGIDKSNVSYVIHYHMPKNLESYYQEAGRAGRDGEPADCILLYAPADVRLNQFLIERSEPNPELTPEQQAQVRERELERLKYMTFYCTTAECLRTFLLQYFGDESPEFCGNCSSCERGFTELDVTVDAQKILSTVVRSGQRFGAKVIADTLLGSDRDRILAMGMQNLTTYGIMKESSGPYIRRVIDRLIFLGALIPSDDSYPILRLGEAARPILRGETSVTMMLPPERPKRERSERRRRRADAAQTDAGLLSVLKKLRQRTASEEGVPAYVIFNNATLTDMAAKCPRTQLEMLDVHGVGRRKLERYGDAFLAAITEYLEGGGKA